MSLASNISTGRPEGGFVPAWWLHNPHLQTLWPVWFRRPVAIPVERQRIELADGDFIDLSWHARGRGPVVMLIHGLEGSLRSHYATPMLASLQQAGCRPVLMHLRGCSGEPNRLARSYHSGATGDLREVLARLDDTGRMPAAVIGVSLGGNLLLKYLGEQGGDARLQSAVAMSVPFRLASAAQRMGRGMSRIYGNHLLRRLKQSYRVKFRTRASPLSVDVDALRSIYEFDDRITAPLNGFAGADEYYALSSCRGYLARIRVPTLILHARDDPFMYPQDVPEPGELGPGVRLELSDRGGHVGFVSGMRPWRPRYWAEARLLRFIASTLAGGEVKSAWEPP